MVRGTPTRGSRAADAVGETAEVVFLGEITGGTGFHHTCRGSVLCKYVVVHGEHWHLDKGAVSGATQAASSSPCGGELAPWGHPFQLAFNTTSVQGSPKLLFAVYERDSLALVDSFVGYGVSALPLKPGPYELTNSIFVANDRNARQTQRVREFFNNTRPELEGWRSLLLHREEMHASPVVTCGMGNVHVSVTVLTKGMDISGTHVARGGGVASKPPARSPRPQSARPRSPVPGDGNGEYETTRGGDRTAAEKSGLDSVRRRFADAAADAVEHQYTPGDGGDGRSTAGGGRAARRSAPSRVADAFTAATTLGRAGEVPVATRRARHAGATAALVSERRAERVTAGGATTGGEGGVVPVGVPSGPDQTYAHQREAIEDAPLASGRDARRALREAREEGGGEVGGRRSRPR